MVFDFLMERLTGEWEDHPYLEAIGIIAAIGVFMVLLFARTIPTEVFASGFMLTLLVVGIVCLILARNTDKDVVGFLFLGESPLIAITALFFGVAFGAAVLIPTNFTILAPLVTVTKDIIQFLPFIYVVIAAPFVEEIFFRGWLFPNLSRAFGAININPIIAVAGAILLTSAAFSVMHLVTYGNQCEAPHNIQAYGSTEACLNNSMGSAFIFSLIAILGNALLGSLAFSYGLHVSLNWAIFSRGV
jgi:membrane protease YdiL (CAAX protease family)